MSALRLKTKPTKSPFAISIYTKLNHDTGPLVAHLRANGEVTWHLKKVIADVLDGTLPATYPTLLQTPAELKAEIAFWRKQLDDGEPFAEQVAKLFGLYPFDSKREITRAAWELVAALKHVSYRVLREAVYPQGSRAGKSVHSPVDRKRRTKK